MTDINKITKSITLDPKVVEWIDQKVEENDTDFTKEISKAINMRKANESRPHDLASLSNNVNRSEVWQLREIRYLLEDILNELKNITHIPHVSLSRHSIFHILVQTTL